MTVTVMLMLAWHFGLSRTRVRLKASRNQLHVHSVTGAERIIQFTTGTPKSLASRNGHIKYYYCRYARSNKEERELRELEIEKEKGSARETIEKEAINDVPGKCGPRGRTRKKPAHTQTTHTHTHAGNREEEFVVHRQPAPHTGKSTGRKKKGIEEAELLYIEGVVPVL